MTTFHDLGLVAPLLRAIEAENYQRPTPIQAQAIPPLLDGRDVLGCAQTGTGKTAAFALPVLQRLAGKGPSRGKPRISALVLTPTRELAAQIGESFAAYGRFLSARHLVIFGGVGEQPQIQALRRGVDVLVATPGRLLDLMGQGHVDLRHVELFVLDEADRMLDMGFVRDVRRVIAALPKQRQNLLFSATMPPAITELAATFLHDPVRVEVTPQSTTVERIEQTVMFVDRPDKRRLLTDLLRDRAVERAIVFTRTKHGANRLTKQLEKAAITAAAIHGNKSQNVRRRALEGFRQGDVAVLVATDLASRGLDVDDVSHVFNYDLPNEPESYVHRIGRTGRAGRSGIAVSFCDASEGEYLRAIERLIGQDIPVASGHAYHCEAAIPPARGQARGGQQGAPRRGKPAGGPAPRSGGRGGRSSGGSAGRSSERGGGRRGAGAGARAGARSGPRPAPASGSPRREGPRPSRAGAERGGPAVPALGQGRRGGARRRGSSGRS